MAAEVITVSEMGRSVHALQDQMDVLIHLRNHSEAVKS